MSNSNGTDAGKQCAARDGSTGTNTGECCGDGCRDVVVVKLGGSILTGLPAYGAAADLLAALLRAGSGERIVAVVSAEYGQTDALERLARSICDPPEPEALDLLWSTGELRSVALLSLALQARGVRARALDVQACGLQLDSRCVDGAGASASTWRLNPLRLRAALAHSDVAVVPGFLARTPGDGVASLGRGGSDLTAVLLASGLAARRCELVKDVPGYFTADPNVDAAAEQIPSLDFAAALAMAAGGCELVQTQALRAARDTGTRLVVRGLNVASGFTIVDAAERLPAAAGTPVSEQACSVS